MPFGGLTVPASAGAGSVVLPGPQLRTGWYGSPLGEVDTVVLTPGAMFAVPFPVNRAVTIDRLGLEVTGTGASTVVRLGLYSNADDNPDALLLDAGTINGATAAFQEITVDHDLDVGRVWLAACAQGSNNVTVRAVRYIASAGLPSSGYAPYSSYALRQGGTSTLGAFPASAPTFNDVRASAPRVLVRVA